MKKVNKSSKWIKMLIPFLISQIMPPWSPFEAHFFKLEAISTQFIIRLLAMKHFNACDFSRISYTFMGLIFDFSVCDLSFAFIHNSKLYLFSSKCIKRKELQLKMYTLEEHFQLHSIVIRLHIRIYEISLIRRVGL